MGYFVYAHNNQKVAAGLRQVWIDPLGGETFIITAAAREGDTMKSTLRAVRYVEPVVTPEPAPDLGAAPVGGDITLSYEVK